MKIETLKSTKDFKRLKNGKFYRSDSFLLQGMGNNESKMIRVGYTVTKQNGNAVIRNRIKRRLKSVVQEVFNSIESNNWDYVMIGKKNTLITSFSNLKSELEFAVNKINKD
jgi:ribonuclease P protein component